MSREAFFSWRCRVVVCDALLAILLLKMCEGSRNVWQPQGRPDQYPVAPHERLRCVALNVFGSVSMLPNTVAHHRLGSTVPVLLARQFHPESGKNAIPWHNASWKSASVNTFRRHRTQRRIRMPGAHGGGKSGVTFATICRFRRTTHEDGSAENDADPPSPCAHSQPR